MKRMITSGVRNTNDSYVFDYDNNSDVDIIDLVYPYLEESSIGKNIYYFGYKFKEDVSSKERSHFIKYIKGLSDEKVDQNELKKFIEVPLAELDRNTDIYHIDAFIYPISGRSNLVNDMIKVINSFTSRDIDRLSFQLVKSVPTDIEFDWKLFDDENKPENDDKYEWHRYNQMKEYIEDILMPKINSLDYFSIANSVKPKYRRYIKNFISFDEVDSRKIEGLKGQNILIVDDINTTGATLEEILRQVRSINSSCNIYIYTLIGQ